MALHAHAKLAGPRGPSKVRNRVVARPWHLADERSILDPPSDRALAVMVNNNLGLALQQIGRIGDGVIHVRLTSPSYPTDRP